MSNYNTPLRIYNPPRQEIFSAEIKTYADGSMWVVLDNNIGLALPVRHTTEEERQIIGDIPLVIDGHKIQLKKNKRRRR